ncbi:hypothetical protein K7A41_07695 [Sphingobacterium sp. InxBP1]|uniref:hypothetical protein n=1 Tax=Sphingobacterium sp. InxBP1 TaxID=2870328 RepID=UPI002243D7B8|nr:hypothetical protein [Sphingobacterium sp. InxBP1]MCW8311101.1 hypothetical protein [Sphingobacterium sp. InxBP1]
MKRFLAVFFLFSGCFVACSEFIEYPLEKKSVNLIAPADSISTVDSVVSFHWEKHEDADKYRLQVATPDFDAIKKIIVDTTTTADHLNLTISPGTYHWRVRPENTGSVGLFSSRQLTISPEAK